MEILVYLLPAVLGIALWLGISELLERMLGKKTDEVSRIRRASRRPHSYKDHNTQYRSATESTISFWKKEKIDSETEDRMRHSIKIKVKGKENECG